MLIVDFYTLQTVYTLYLAEHVVLYCLDALDSQDVVRVNTTFCKFVTGLQILTIYLSDS